MLRVSGLRRCCLMRRRGCIIRWMRVSDLYSSSYLKLTSGAGCHQKKGSKVAVERLAFFFCHLSSSKLDSHQYVAPSSGLIHLRDSWILGRGRFRGFQKGTASSYSIFDSTSTIRCSPCVCFSPCCTLPPLICMSLLINCSFDYRSQCTNV